MRIIHTSDWHIGKNLDNVSRLEEQERFLTDFENLVEEKNPDIVLIAGDIYDTYNPPIQAESLFYKTIKKISNGGERCVFIIAGNHDSPEKLESIRPLVREDGIVILGYPTSSADIGRYRGFEIIEAYSGFTKIRINGEVINIASLPYPSEKRLNEVFEGIEDTTVMQKSYSQKIGDIFSELEKGFRDDEINIATSHLFVVGSNISDSERRIELGGSMLVEKENLPKKSQYTALGHIHKPQVMSKKLNVYYSGSPIQYSKNERDTSKSVYIVDLEAGKEAVIEKEYVRNYRPIKVFNCDSLEDAFLIVDRFGEEDIYSYFEINTDKAIELEDLKRIKKGMKNVMEIRPVYTGEKEFEKKEIVDINKSNIEKYFCDFFRKSNSGLEPSQEVVDLFLDFISEDEDEANKISN